MNQQHGIFRGSEPHLLGARVQGVIGGLCGRRGTDGHSEPQTDVVGTLRTRKKQSGEAVHAAGLLSATGARAGTVEGEDLRLESGL